nr:hypothetical protein [uncultured Pseudomonas sp.]
MKKLRALLLSLLPLSGYAMASDEKTEPYIPNDELVNFILEEVSKDIPNPWYSARMVATIKQAKDGQTLLEASYTYKAAASSKEAVFEVSNVFGPLNAAKRLQSQMKAEGKPWSTIAIELRADGNYEVHVQ